MIKRVVLLLPAWRRGRTLFKNILNHQLENVYLQTKQKNHITEFLETSHTMK
jgi:hypothetical protein